MAVRNGFGLIFRSPLTWFAMLVCGLFVWGVWRWFDPPWLVRLASVALAAVVFGLWPWFYMRSEQYVRAVYGLNDQGEDDGIQDVGRLVKDFDVLGFQQGGEQVRMLREKYQNLAEVLRRRLDAGELTYRRYLGMAESVYFAAIENLQDVAISLRSISTIDPTALRLKIEDLKKETDFAIPEAIHAIEDRRRIYEEQRQRIAKLLAQTEAAMTALDHTATALARTRTSKGLSSVGIEDAMKDLEELAGRAGKYAVENS
ncbi:MAG TPA: hypothetical protein DCZ69_17245 [Syntrophobacteraceae bacterium]|nr:hypothetical protein [Syntrophobacteraceae bacterium]HBD09999.1 hypothetical protein [Syntrophobacteraceae bacterium]HBZ55528.1 hypothetical protein [Syntrophobacteraceae bacterium]